MRGVVRIRVKNGGDQRMVIWLNGPYGVGKSALAEKLHERNTHSFIFDAEEVGNAVRDNMPKELFNGYIFEDYPLWFKMCVELLTDIVSRYDGDIYVPMTLVYADSFEKIERLLKERGICVRHILLESSHQIIHDRILARGETKDCWCMRHIDLCLNQQRDFENVIRIESYGKSVSELAVEVENAIFK